MLPDIRSAELDIEALADAARQLVRRARLHVDDGRVADTVDARSIRYYQTLGIIDRPSRYEGRRAVYGFRHLLQLLAIRQLQQEGYSLSLIQSALPARSTAELEQAVGHLFARAADPIPGIPDLPLSLSSPTVAKAFVPVPDAAQAPAVAPVRSSPLPQGPPEPYQHGERADRAAWPRPVLVAEVAPGITLSIDPGRVANADAVFQRLAGRIAQALEED